MPVFHGPVRKANFWVAIPIRDAKDTLVTSKRSAGKERTTEISSWSRVSNSVPKSHLIKWYKMNGFWFKQTFIRDKIKIQKIIMCSSTSYSYIAYRRWAHIWINGVYCRSCSFYLLQGHTKFVPRKESSFKTFDVIENGGTRNVKSDARSDGQSNLVNVSCCVP